MRVRIEAGRARGCVQAIPSKSMAHRLLLCAALAQGESVVRGVTESEDMLATLDCIRALGATWTRSGDCVTVRGGGTKSGAVFPCRESGSTLRFFIPAALLSGGEAVFTGTPRLLARGIGIYETLLSARGVEIRRQGQELRLRGALTAGDYTLAGDVSSQFVSGLLLALPLLGEDSTLRVLPPVESRAYIDLTIAAMRAFGVEAAEESPNFFRLAGAQRYCPRELAVEGDWSNAAALYAFQALGGAVTVTGLSADSRQADRVCLALLRQLEQANAEIELSGCPDLAPVLFAVAAARHGAHFTGTRRLHIKESDRAQAMAQELQKFGIRADVGENSVTVYAGTLHTPQAVLDGHNDHRIVMALALLCSKTGGEIAGAEAIAKSDPTYFDTLRALGLELTLCN